ncbi:MAG: hypothetical protein ACI8PD_000935 [Nitrospinales bacterium]|jgi:hypothetical protein
MWKSNFAPCLQEPILVESVPLEIGCYNNLDCFPPYIKKEEKNFV